MNTIYEKISKNYFLLALEVNMKETHVNFKRRYLSRYTNTNTNCLLLKRSDE